MSDQLTIILSSAGRRVGLLNCLRDAARDLGLIPRIVALDLDPDRSTACLSADRRVRVPRADDPGFIPAVLEVARTEGARLLVPTIDTELAAYAAARSAFEEIGCAVHVSSPDVVAIARDKRRTAAALKSAGIAVPETYDWHTLTDGGAAVDWPVIGKPVSGSSGKGIVTLAGPEDLAAKPAGDLIFQDLLSGPEYTVSIFVDRAGTLRTSFAHLREQTRGGEVEKGLSVRLPEIDAISAQIVDALPGLWGTVCYQLIHDPVKGPRVFEINARFGGGYPLAHHCGARFAQWLIEDATGRPLSAHDDWTEGVRMLRHDSEIFV
ncbi:ATP-grasp domain-containing protein [Oceanomicrobium pacificus]|uniref:ATP-grasp domain-containing protein n=1 Tax=Oceanomicrobium pacificus TaxID=2692916 RepID=A0A6B0TMY7_9RHOB|nr:ATP-grasp domain-containing protein [Oceanomicrobium pacificus]MXU65216.1 ATP-grasp domain-containing protein [Oceanomicrobium pacificus]